MSAIGLPIDRFNLGGLMLQVAGVTFLAGLRTLRRLIQIRSVAILALIDLRLRRGTMQTAGIPPFRMRVSSVTGVARRPLGLCGRDEADPVTTRRCARGGRILPDIIPVSLRLAPVASPSGRMRIGGVAGGAGGVRPRPTFIVSPVTEPAFRLGPRKGVAAVTFVVLPCRSFLSMRVGVGRMAGETILTSLEIFEVTAVTPLTGYRTAGIAGLNRLSMPPVVGDPFRTLRMGVIGMAGVTVLIVDLPLEILSMTALADLLAGDKRPPTMIDLPRGGVGIGAMAVVTPDLGNSPLQIVPVAEGGAGLPSVLEGKGPVLFRILPANLVGIILVTVVATDLAASPLEVVPMTTLTDLFTAPFRDISMNGGSNPLRGVRIDRVAEGAGDFGKPPLKVITMTLGRAPPSSVRQDGGAVHLFFDPVLLMGILGMTRGTGRDLLFLAGRFFMAFEAGTDPILGGRGPMGGGGGPRRRVGKDRDQRHIGTDIGIDTGLGRLYGGPFLPRLGTPRHQKNRRKNNDKKPNE